MHVQLQWLSIYTALLGRKRGEGCTPFPPPPMSLITESPQAYFVYGAMKEVSMQDLQSGCQLWHGDHTSQSQLGMLCKQNLRHDGRVRSGPHQGFLAHPIPTSKKHMYWRLTCLRYAGEIGMTPELRASLYIYSFDHSGVHLIATPYSQKHSANPEWTKCESWGESDKAAPRMNCHVKVSERITRLTQGHLKISILGHFTSRLLSHNNTQGKLCALTYT